VTANHPTDVQERRHVAADPLDSASIPSSNSHPVGGTSPFKEGGAAFMQRSKTITEWCEMRHYSKTKYFKMRKEGRGPRELRVEGTVRITPESDADWVREHEAPTGAEARLVERERQARIRQTRNAGRAAAASPKHVSKRHAAKR
jgi:hypothetical protein